jgi:opacity protein-like surface antigen
VYGFLSHLHSLMVTMSQKSSVPQAAISVSQALMSDRFNNTMLYLTGGGAWANIEYNATFITTPPLNLANPSQTTIKSGWVVGGGAEWMATPNILLRAEYLYYGIDSSNNLSAVAFPIPAPLPVAVNWGKENIQVFRVAAAISFSPARAVR